MQNKEIRLASRPTGLPSDSNFQFVESSLPPLKDGEVLLRSLYISVDPYLRGRMREVRSYVPPFAIGDVITSGVVSEVVESRAPNLQPGNIVVGYLGWRVFNIAAAKELTIVDPQIAPITTALGVLGIPGLTAYFGLLDIGQPKERETVVVSGAAGAVGITVCQIAKIKGCRVVGTSGSDEKNKYLLDDLGVDVAINYKSGNVAAALAAACPKGVDVYFDNVGGSVSDAVAPLINHSSRTVLCGQISIYNLDKPDVGLRPQPFLLVKSSLMKGFIITDYMSRFGEGIRQLVIWFKEGKLKYAETVVEGFENTPRAFIGLFSGDNLGKQLVKVG
jgi:NADPH-dependent curcumin reductase CurA